MLSSMFPAGSFEIAGKTGPTLAMRFRHKEAASCKQHVCIASRGRIALYAPGNSHVPVLDAGLGLVMLSKFCIVAVEESYAYT